MRALIEGKLVKLDSGTALVKVGQIGYEVMLPAYCVAQLSDKVGTELTLCTMEYYEGTPGGGNMIPRLVGFLTTAERDFFTKYTSVKGIGIRKALRSLNIPIATIAAAIEQGDEKTLTTMPAIGKRMAQQIIAQLKGRLEDFAITKPQQNEEPKLHSFQTQALEILIAWGEKRNEALEFIQQACKKHPNIETPEELVPLVYKIKQGAEV